MPTIDVTQDSRYAELLACLQAGDWKQAAERLSVLRADYPDSAELARHEAETGVRIDLEANWKGKIGGHRWRIRPRRVPVSAFAIILFAGTLTAGVTFYQRVMQPLMQQNARTAAEDAGMQQALTMLQSGDYEGADRAFAELLTANPLLVEAAQRREEIQRNMELDREYQEGLAALEAGDWERARQVFASLSAKSPGYRDVPRRLGEINERRQVSALFAESAAAFANKDWEEAITRFEELRQLDGGYEAETVTTRLGKAYQLAALAEVNRSPDEGADLEKALRYVRKALTLDASDPVAGEEQKLLLDYAAANRALQGVDYGAAIPQLEAVFERRHDYLDGFLAQQLYHSFLALGDQLMQAGERQQASEQYSKAANMPGLDVNEALLRLESTMTLLTPTMTPTPTPEPTATAVPTGEPKPTATPAPIEFFKGWIVFSSDRPGGGVLVMRPDGSGVRPLRDSEREKLDAIRERERYSPDGTTYLYAQGSPTDKKRVNLYKMRTDLPANWERTFRLTDNPGQTYDGVWSPANERIAYVSNTTGNDEIWTMGTDGSDPVQLTNNGWEWDKHPTWSPDGSQIVFFSNRSGTLQLWHMNADGTGLLNLSNNNSNDSDPIWLK